MAAPSEDRAHEDAVDSALEAVEPVVELRVSLLACWKGPWPLWTAVKALFASLAPLGSGSAEALLAWEAGGEFGLVASLVGEEEPEEEQDE